MIEDFGFIIIGATVIAIVIAYIHQVVLGPLLRRRRTEHVDDEAFIRDEMYAEHHVPRDTILGWRRFINEEYWLRDRRLIRPEMTLSDFSDLGGPHAGAEGMDYLLISFEKAGGDLEALLDLPLNAIICECWRLGIEPGY